MLSKAQIKYIRSLTLQKYRKQHQVFIAEGDKIAREWLLSKAKLIYIVALEAWADKYHELIKSHPEAQVAIVSLQELQAVSVLQTPNQVLLVAAMPAKREFISDQGWTIALDTIQDPGNLGSIIRIADWFGIPEIVCSPDCADIYNPKVVQAAMGGHLRIHFSEMPLSEFLSGQNRPVLAAGMNGENLYKAGPFKEGILLIGNESKGLDKDLIQKATHRITIPRLGAAESLNAAVATGIICSHLLKDSSG